MKPNIINLAENKEFNEYIGKVNSNLSNKVHYQYVYTFGCQMNVHESEMIQGILLKCGYEPAHEPADADIIILNTCCIREHAESKILGLLGTLKELKNKNNDLIIGICGCMTQQEEFAKKIKSKFHYVDIILGTNCTPKLPEAIYKAITENETKKRRTLFVDKEGCGICENSPVLRADSVCSWLTVMYGCNNFCTYCIVPYVRGRERSRNPEAILNDARKLVENGTKEITLLGQNVNSYGKEMDYSFAKLIREMNKIDGLERIRFMTSHPKDISDELISAFGDCEKLCEHLHLPLQSGSDKILKEMNRHYDLDAYRRIINKLRLVRPDIELSTDLIVGFPGETEDDFKRTLDAVEEMRYSFAFSFAYSPRKGTKAAEMENQIANSVKKERLNKLIDLQNSISAQISAGYVGKTVEVLSEGRVMGDNDEDKNISFADGIKQVGKTRTNKKVYFTSDEDTEGKLVKTKITRSVSVTLGGEITE